MRDTELLSSDERIYQHKYFGRISPGEEERRMSSACLVLKQPSFGAAPWSRPLTVSSSSDTNGSQTSLWRPWLSSSRDRPERCPHSKLSCPYSRPTVPDCFSSDGKPQAFQHPVRLFWPKSKSFDYLYSDGEALLRNFPIQATISFYEESDSEDEDEEDWEEDGSSEECLKHKSHFTSYN
ncbi:protein ripply1 [Thunnus albacares]|uniref:protein ripply1-like n=1 Tax=Thunnus maccoyii TaxID=8240 RepID=UPI001C4C55AB|nr:protein ripply1-like [Thunnus maccoyii]XP_044226687.1 protein ripply1 [Thunnus albacares]